MGHPRRNICIQSSRREPLLHHHSYDNLSSVHNEIIITAELLCPVHFYVGILTSFADNKFTAQSQADSIVIVVEVQTIIFTRISPLFPPYFSSSDATGDSNFNSRCQSSTRKILCTQCTDPTPQSKAERLKKSKPRQSANVRPTLRWDRHNKLKINCLYYQRHGEKKQMQVHLRVQLAKQIPA